MSRDSSIVWQDRDRAIVSALTHRVRLLSASQAARGWWKPGAEAAASRRLRQLVVAKVLDCISVLSHPELDLCEPIARWTPGMSAPNYGQLAHRLQGRWTRPPEPTTVYIATPSSARRFGGKAAGLRRPLQATHDLHVTSVYIRYLLDTPELADLWVSEDILAPTRRHEKLPDAMIVIDGRPFRVVEFGGSYDAERVGRVHDDCARRRIPYELW